MAEQEGVIKYQLDHQEMALPEGIDIGQLVDWRSRLMAAGLVGQDPDRYDGYGFGNLSMRWGDGFLITGSQTGHVEELTRDHFAWVTEALPEKNHITSKGMTPPSSESLTHAALYAALPEAHFVFHGHSPEIWQKAEQLGLPITAPVPYGTPEMAREVARLMALADTRAQQIFSMAGHEDGVMSFGRSAESAGHALLSAQARAKKAGHSKE